MFGPQLRHLCAVSAIQRWMSATGQIEIPDDQREKSYVFSNVTDEKVGRWNEHIVSCGFELFKTEIIASVVAGPLPIPVP